MYLYVDILDIHTIYTYYIYLSSIDLWNVLHMEMGNYDQLLPDILQKEAPSLAWESVFLVEAQSMPSQILNYSTWNFFTMREIWKSLMLNIIL
jgi:hypothetical protein